MAMRPASLNCIFRLAMSSEASTPPQPKAPRRFRLAVLALPIVALLALLAMLFWLLGTTSGARMALSAAVSASGGKLQIGAVEGRLAGPLKLAQVRLQGTGMETELRDVSLDWEPQDLFQQRLHITALRVDAIRLRQRIGQPSGPATLPDNLSLPLKVTVDRMQIDHGTLNWGALNVIELGAFSIRLDYDGARYLAALDQLTASSDKANADPGSKDKTGQAGFRGSLRGELTLADKKPYALNGTYDIQANVLAGQQPISGIGQVRLSGNLARTEAATDLAIGTASVKGHATLQAFSDTPLANADIQVRGLDLAMFSPTWPRTKLDGKLLAKGADGTLMLSNAEAGVFDGKRLPLRTLSTRFRQDREGLHLDAIKAALGSSGDPAGELQGSGRLFQGALQLGMTTTSLDLRALDRRLLSTRLAGSAGIRHESGRQEISLNLSEPLSSPLQKRRLALSANATLANEALALDRAELTLGKGALRASGRLQLGGKREFAASGALDRFRLQDLGRFDSIPELYLNGEFSLKGALAPQPAADLDFRIADSRLAGQPLEGEGRARLRADSLDIPKLVLAAGANRLDMAGQLQQDRGQLTFTLAAPKLDQLGPGFAGALQASGTAQGSFASPAITAQWQASRLLLPKILQLESSQGKGEIQLDRKAAWMLGRANFEIAAQGVRSGTMRTESVTASVQFAPQPDAPLLLQLRAQKFAVADYQADSISIDTSGSTGRHTLTAALAQPRQQWQLQAAGALQPQQLRWQGSIEQLTGAGPMQAKLAGPAALNISRQRIDLRQFHLAMEGALLAVEQFSRDDTGMQTRGRFDHLALATLLNLLQPQPDVRTDLQFSGAWDLTLAGAPRGTFLLQRESGDLSMRGAAPITLGLRRLEARANADNGKLRVALHAEGTNLGSIEVDAGMAIDSASRLGISPQSALSGSARVSVPSLRWIAPLIGPTAIADGSLDGDLKLAGNLDTPSLAGQLRGQRLRLSLPDLGVDLRGGILDATFQDTRLMLQSLAFASNGGKLSMSGPIDLAGTHPDAQLAVNAEHYPLLTRSDRKLVVSGNGAVTYRQGRLQATGGFSADSGLIDLGQSDKPELSSDVVIAGKASKQAASLPALDVVIGLGEGVTVRGRGLDAVLVGQVQFRNAAGEPLKAQGAMRVERGTVAAYGRELAIEKGILYFNGAPGNPGLDILAMRRGQQVEAGVAVLGTALSPRIMLVSEPSVPDAEKLSWLVLGHGLDTSTKGGDLAALQSAAGTLLGQGAAAGVTAGLAGALGLDQLSLGTSSGTLQQRIITVGKQVSSRLHIGIEQGLERASSVLLLRYTISRKLTLEIDTGTRTAFSVFYNFAFD